MPLILVRVVCRISDVRDRFQQLVVSTLVDFAVNALGDSARNYVSAICVNIRYAVRHVHMTEL